VSPAPVELITKNDFMSELKDIDIKADHFQELMDLYTKALEKTVAYMEDIKSDIQKFYDYEIIDHISSRIKKPESIIKKMEKKGFELNYKELIENINDVAGVRVICPLKRDIYKLKEILENMDEITILEERDYISKPKKSGYTSFHLIIAVPVEYKESTMYIKVEIQIRTMAMDFWATLEHRMKYKTSSKYTDECSKEFIKFAKTLTSFDNKIGKLYEKQFGKNKDIVVVKNK